jgi:UDP-2,4-diacetamido-2,4,6-trideoxy-beta-L-altropyranose hydrolase
METMVFRVDANSQIGTGHFMRCLALAQAWKDKGNEAIFITSCQNEGLLQRLRDESFKIYALSLPGPEDWPETHKILSDYPNAWVMLDGYLFDEVYEKQIKQAGHRLLVIDDMAHLKHYYADIVVNQNLGAEQRRYSCEPYTRLLLGTQYIMLRRDFLARKDWERKIPVVAKRVLVTLGGGDPENYTLKVVQALQRVTTPNLEITIVVGASNLYVDRLKAAIKPPLRLVYDANNMPELMAQADIAVIAAGTTVWELAFMGCPTISYAGNSVHETIIKAMDKQQVLQYLGYIDKMEPDALVSAINELAKDQDKRRAFCQAGRQLVDGQGAERVLKAIAALS